MKISKIILVILIVIMISLATICGFYYPSMFNPNYKLEAKEIYTDPVKEIKLFAGVYYVENHGFKLIVNTNGGIILLNKEEVSNE